MLMHAVLVQEDGVRDLRRMKVIPMFVGKGRLFRRPAGCWFGDRYRWGKGCCSGV